MLTPDALQELQTDAEAALATSTTAAELEAWRVTFLGRRGKVPLLLRQVKELAAAERQEIGALGNTLRLVLEEAYARKRQTLSSTPTVPARGAEEKQAEVGHLHPLTLTMRRLQRIFLQQGFTLVEGPLVEEPEYNFDLLNIPADHPARAETDTFYLTNGKILRTHVSPLQIRAPREEALKPPFQIFYMGRCFRAEKKDATHEDTFHQFEFLVVSKTVSLANLKAIVERTYTDFFGTVVSIRLRPAYFPFVEPGLEVDISCPFCEQRGCAVCKQSGWIEIAGAGAVHPTVLKNMGVDPTEYQGIALGGAIDRLAMLRYGINDIRLFWSGEISFLRQFS